MFPLYDDNPAPRVPLVTYALVAINVAALFWMSHLSPSDQQLLAYRRGFVPARIQQLRQPHPLVVPMNVAVHIPFWGDRVVQRPIQLAPDPRQIILSLLTCMFLHGGWIHLLGNMWFLLLFGNNVEGRLGPARYVILYLLGGVLASAAHWAADPTSAVPVIGASGAVAAVLGAYAVTWPWAKVSTLVILVVFITIIDVPALVVLGVWFAAQILESTRGEASAGVAWWAHIGGFAAGALLMPLLGATRWKDVEDQQE